VFQHIPGIGRDLPKPDLIPIMQIGMHAHCPKCSFHFIKTHERLDQYNPTRLSMPGYHDLQLKTKSYEELSQSNGKEMKEMSQYLLGVGIQSLRGGSPTQHAIFNRAI
jgi:hypothetical protein